MQEAEHWDQIIHADMGVGGLQSSKIHRTPQAAFLKSRPPPRSPDQPFAQSAAVPPTLQFGEVGGGELESEHSLLGLAHSGG